MTPEGRVKARVSALLKKYPGVWHAMPVTSGYGTPLLDYIGCAGGMFFAVETKAKGKTPNPRQRMTIEKLCRAGAVVFVVTGDEPLDELERFLQASIMLKLATTP